MRITHGSVALADKLRQLQLADDSLVMDWFKLTGPSFADGRRVQVFGCVKLVARRNRWLHPFRRRFDDFDKSSPRMLRFAWYLGGEVGF